MRHWSLLAVFLALAPSGAHAGPFDDVPFDDIPRPGGPQDMKLLMRLIEEVTVYRYNGSSGHTARKIRRQDLKARCPKCVTMDGQYYFADWDAVLERNLPWALQVCKREVTPGTAVSLSRADTFPCRKAKGEDGGVVRGATVGYSLRRSTEGIHVETKVRFDLDASTESAISPARGVEMMKTVKACLPTIRRVWAGLGLIFDLRVDSNRSPERGAPDVTALLIDHAPDSAKGRRSDQKKYYFDASDGDICTLMLHETGHNLGLDDEYQDDECPDRPLIASETKPWSFMGGRHHDPDDLSLFSRHIRRVLSPLCRSPSPPGA